jgi:hypothetical protein
MAISNRFPTWGESGTSPVDGFSYQGGEQVNEKHLDYLWDSLDGMEQDINAELDRLDSEVSSLNDQTDEYLWRDGRYAATGTLDMGNNSIINIANLDFQGDTFDLNGANVTNVGSYGGVEVTGTGSGGQYYKVGTISSDGGGRVTMRVSGTSRSGSGGGNDDALGERYGQIFYNSTNKSVYTYQFVVGPDDNPESEFAYVKRGDDTIDVYFYAGPYMSATLYVSEGHEFTHENQEVASPNGATAFDKEFELQDRLVANEQIRARGGMRVPSSSIYVQNSEVLRADGSVSLTDTLDADGNDVLDVGDLRVDGLLYAVSSELDIRDNIDLADNDVRRASTVHTAEVSASPASDGSVDFNDPINLEDNKIIDVQKIETDDIESPDSPNIRVVNSGLNMNGNRVRNAYKVATDRLQSPSNNFVRVQDNFAMEGNNVRGINALGAYQGAVGMVDDLDMRNNGIRRAEDILIQSNYPEIQFEDTDASGTGANGSVHLNGQQLWIGNRADTDGIEIDMQGSMTIDVYEGGNQQKRLYP